MNESFSYNLIENLLPYFLILVSLSFIILLITFSFSLYENSIYINHRQKELSLNINSFPHGIVTNKKLYHYNDEFFISIKSPDDPIPFDIKVNKQIFDSLNINDDVSNPLLSSH